MSESETQAHADSESSVDSDLSTEEGTSQSSADEGAVTGDDSALQGMKEQLIRLAADFENYKKRSVRDQEQNAVRVTRTVLEQFLPVMDNLTRALEHADDSPLSDGLKMVFRQFEECLGKFNVHAYASIGEPFDPEHHEALSQLPSPDMAAGVVMQEVVRGYKIGDMLLRPAQVIVSSGAPTGSESA